MSEDKNSISKEQFKKIYEELEDILTGIITTIQIGEDVSLYPVHEVMDIFEKIKGRDKKGATIISLFLMGFYFGELASQDEEDEEYEDEGEGEVLFESD